MSKRVTPVLAPPTCVVGGRFARYRSAAHARRGWSAMRALGSWAVGAHRNAFAWAFGETGVVVIATAIVLAQLDRWDGVRFEQPAREVFTALALAAAGVAAAAAVVALVGPGHRRRLAAPLGLYGLVLGPVGLVEEPGV